MLDGAAVDDGQGTGQAEAHRTNGAVGRGGLVLRRTAAEHFAAGEQLDVDFQPDDGFVFHNLWRWRVQRMQNRNAAAKYISGAGPGATRRWREQDHWSLTHSFVLKFSKDFLVDLLWLDQARARTPNASQSS